MTLTVSHIKFTNSNRPQGDLLKGRVLHVQK